MDLMEAEIHELQAANEALSKRRRAKKTRLRKGGSLSIQEAQELGDQMEVEVQLKAETCNGAGQQLQTKTRAQRCGNCRKAGHNARSCQIVVEMSEEGDSG
ncbi:uncharacterized protein EURHEDRAFT_417866 [Aspergillus ruber CBS 135680]|uniref:CCHC-type domain-containing protein n=1 Tax=Aspergillus ruber (strain CBS 135680) TaxID=1388766 RepID=A0A017RZ15_ASPRC|nr:uncharacterized protein EURHEDRAFT_417866 [Aspergillus ruber CBS 135680]EYE90008.1 hypothetical protein EURHEDRAFT_417866 [Aspergillus ruber CBS 135680]